MLTKNQRKEQQLIQFSIAMGSIYTIAGVFWGVLIQSGIILFDAIYFGTSILLSMMTMYALKIISKDNNFDANHYKASSFHMGKTAIEPLVNIIKSLVIIFICFCGLVGAVLTLNQGATYDNIKSLSGIYYGVITALLCISTWGYLMFFGNQYSDLIQAECEQWMVDAVFSLLVVVSFFVSFLLSKTQSMQHISGYVDPITVIIATIYFIQVPIKRLIKSTKELLVMTPSDTVQEQITHALQPILSRYAFEDQVARTTKTGRQLYVDITFIIQERERTFKIEQFDKIREEIEQSLKSISDDLWLTVSFTSDRYWA